eukprot:g10516.t1
MSDTLITLDLAPLGPPFALWDGERCVPMRWCISAAMVAATAVPLALNWTDVIKTRMQGVPVQGCTAAPYNGGFSGTARRILAEEGAPRVVKRRRQKTPKWERIWSSVSGFRLVLQDGLWSLFRGSGANVVRSICMTVGTVPVYEHTKHLAKSHQWAEELDARGDGPQLHLAAGLVAGVVGTSVTAPADVIRTRVMQEGRGGTSMFGAAVGLWRDAGPVGLVSRDFDSTG